MVVNICLKNVDLFKCNFQKEHNHAIARFTSGIDIFVNQV